MFNIRWNKDFLLSFADSHITGPQKRPLSSSKKEDIFVSQLLIKAQADLKETQASLIIEKLVVQLEPHLAEWERLHNVLAKESNPLLLEEKRLIGLKIDNLKREFCKEWEVFNGLTPKADKQ